MYVCYGLLHTYCNKLRGAFFVGKTRTFYSRKEYMKSVGVGGGCRKTSSKYDTYKNTFCFMENNFVSHFLGFILQPFSRSVKTQLMPVPTPECIVCFMLMNVKVLVVHCGSITAIAIIGI